MITLQASILCAHRDDDDNNDENNDCNYDTVDDTMSTNRHVIASVFLMQGCCSCWGFYDEDDVDYSDDDDCDDDDDNDNEATPIQVVLSGEVFLAQYFWSTATQKKGSWTD